MKTRTIASSVFGTAAHRGRRVAACFVILACSALGVGVALVACGGAPNSGFSPSGVTDRRTAADRGALAIRRTTATAAPPSSTRSPMTVRHRGRRSQTAAARGCSARSNTCTNDGGTTIVGKVMDPAGANPLYNVLAYVPMFDPAQPSKIPAGYGIEPITGGVTFPSGVSCDSCSYLYTGNPIAIGTTGTKRDVHDHQRAERNEHPGRRAGRQVADARDGVNRDELRTGRRWLDQHALVRSGEQSHRQHAADRDLRWAERTPWSACPTAWASTSRSSRAAPARAGIFTCSRGAAASEGIIPGTPPSSSANMWNSLADLEKYDVSLFSCEGGETAAANPPILESYVNAGGRAFLSHYHYAWLAGPLETGSTAGYSANADWGARSSRAGTATIRGRTRGPSSARRSRRR